MHGYPLRWNLRKVLAVTFTITLTVGLCSCSTEPSSTPVPPTATVKIAMSGMFESQRGLARRQAVEMALDEAGHQAGDVRVELLPLDTSPTPFDPAGAPSLVAEQRAARQALADPTVVAYLGSPFTSMTQAVLPQLNRGGLAQLSTEASWPGLTQPGFGAGEPAIYYPSGRRHFFRLTPTDNLVGAAAARWADDLGLRRVFVVDNGSSYGRGLAGAFELTARDLGMQVLGRITFDYQPARIGGELGPHSHGRPPRLPAPLAPQGGIQADVQSDARSAAAKAVAAEPDLIFFGGTDAEGGRLFTSTIRAQTAGMPIFGARSLLPLDEAELPEYGSHIYITAPGLPGGPHGIDVYDFAQRYQNRFGSPPLPGVLQNYEAARVLLHVIAQAKTPDRAGVLDALDNLRDFEGLLGRWRFDANGDTTFRTMDCYELRDGRRVWVRRIEP